MINFVNYPKSLKSSTKLLNMISFQMFDQIHPPKHLNKNESKRVQTCSKSETSNLGKAISSIAVKNLSIFIEASSKVFPYTIIQKRVNLKFA